MLSAYVATLTSDLDPLARALLASTSTWFFLLSAFLLALVMPMAMVSHGASWRAVRRALLALVTVAVTGGVALDLAAARDRARLLRSLLDAPVVTATSLNAGRAVLLTPADPPLPTSGADATADVASTPMVPAAGLTRPVDLWLTAEHADAALGALTTLAAAGRPWEAPRARRLAAALRAPLPEAAADAGRGGGP